MIPTAYEYPTQGFVIDHKTYYFDTESIDEAHYLAALLNAPCVDIAIKVHQTRGIYKGERDIHRTPFEACIIPAFDATTLEHLALAQLSIAAHLIIIGTTLDGEVVKARRTARTVVADQIEQIDAIARRLLGLPTMGQGSESVPVKIEDAEA
jgi:hypothetical protein